MAFKTTTKLTLVKLDSVTAEIPAITLSSSEIDVGSFTLSWTSTYLDFRYYVLEVSLYEDFGTRVTGYAGLRLTDSSLIVNNIPSESETYYCRIRGDAGLWSDVINLTTS